MIEPLYTVAECYNDINYWNQRYGYLDVLKEYNEIRIQYRGKEILEKRELQRLKNINDEND
jgi:hypothetical protein